MTGLSLLMQDMLRQPPVRRRLLAEGFVGLIAARLAVRCVPFQRLCPFFLRPVSTPEPSREAREQLRSEIRWALARAGRYLPGQTVCFPQAIAAQWMLRRRGVATQLYYGARTTSEEGLGAHVWLQDGDVGVVGKRRGATYCVLARYSNGEREESAAL